MDALALDTVGQLMYIRALMSRAHVTRDAFDAVANACRAYERQHAATRGGAERSAVQRLSLHFDTHRNDPDNALLGLRATLAVDDAVVSSRSFDLMARVRESEQALVAPQLHRELLSWLALPDAELLSRARALARCAVEVWPAGALVLVPDDASGGTGRMRFGRFSGRRVGLALGVFTSPAERTDTLYQLAHVLPVPTTDVLGGTNRDGLAECAFVVFRALEEAAVRRCMARFLTLHGFDNDLSECLALTPEAPDAVRASSVHSLHRNERLLSQMKRSHSQNRERCAAYVRRSARAAAARMVRHCDHCLSETLEIDAAAPPTPSDAEPDALGRPLVTDLLDNLRALPEHVSRMVAVLDREVLAAAARHRAAARALANRLDGVRTGVAKQELHTWWTTLIKEATLAHMRAVGVDLSAVGDDYTTRPPADLNLVRRNCDILVALLDADSDTHNTKALLDTMCNIVYPRVNQFIDDALVAVAIACAVAPSVYERQYDAATLLAALRAHLADALAAEARAPLSKSSRDDDTDASEVVVAAAAIADDDSDLDTASDSPYENIRTSGNFLARRSMSSISGGLCLSDSDRSVMSIANAFGFGSSSSVGASLQWCETTLDDVAYLITMKQLERAGVAAERLGPVPVSGLVVGRITRCLQEHRTVLEVFGGDGDSNARVRSTSARSVLANVSLFRRRRGDVDGSLSPRSPRFWFSRSNRVTEQQTKRMGGGGGDKDTVGTNDDNSLGSANSDDESSSHDDDGAQRSCRSADDDRDAFDHSRNQRHRHSEGSSSGTRDDVFRSHHRRITRHRHSFGSVLTANGSTNDDFTIDDDDDDDDDSGNRSRGKRRSSGGGKSPKLRQSTSETRVSRSVVGFAATETAVSVLAIPSPPETAEPRWKAAHSARRRKSAADSIVESSTARMHARVRGSVVSISPPTAAALGMHRVDKQARNQST